MPAWSWCYVDHSVLAALDLAVADGRHHLVVAFATASRSLVLRPRSFWPQRLRVETAGLAAARAIGDRTAEVVLLRRRADTAQMLCRNASQWLGSSASAPCRWSAGPATWRPWWSRT
ncbi:hypothetical protein Acsp05_03460 [Actinokineospora sp. NBRC 105648]|nr:hypothetical protein Acsp05_03460 [Actinokineospora sp. NBRC 105648]